MVEIKFAKTQDEVSDSEVAVVVATGKPTGKNTKYLTEEEKTLLKDVFEREQASDKEGSTVSITTAQRRLIWVIYRPNNDETVRRLGGKLYLLLKKFSSAVIFGFSGNDLYEGAFGFELRSYRFEKFFTKRQPEDYDRLEKVTFVDEKADASLYAPYTALSAGVRYARDLTNEPANTMTPIIMAEDIKRLEYLGLKVEILDEKEMKEFEFNLALSVAQGSVNPPRIAVIRWTGRGEEADYDLGLVGKGVTFDSGGISLKPSKGMEDMKQDMAGAAAVVGAMKVAALQKLPKNIVAVVGLVENMPSGSATRPGDVVRSMSGQTVEILNTDAEGRLVLADCLWYIQERFGVRKVIDIATLTGAILVALGKEMAGLMSNNQDFADRILKAGNESGERFWQLPLGKGYDKLMDSSIADMVNCDYSRQAGSITAACFLKRYIQKDVQWAHMDIAAMDKEEKGTDLTPKGASGFGVRIFNRIMHNL